MVKAVLVDTDPDAKWVDHLIGSVGPEKPRHGRDEPDDPARLADPPVETVDPVDTIPRNDGSPVSPVAT